MNPNSLVSVCIITYNHQEYIKNAVVGALNQETDFPFEVNVFDDCSTDNTEKAITQIIREHPKGSVINYIRHQKNIGLEANYIYSIKYCRGKYVAICEGDDYWIDKSKLQKQVNFLEQHNDYYLCFHKAIRLNTVESNYSVYPDVVQTDYTDNTFFSLITIPMGSVIFRNTQKIKFSRNTIQLDFNLLCSLLTLGRARMINEVMSVYRVHENATTFNRSSGSVKQRIEVLLKESGYKEYNRVVRKEIGRMYGAHIVHLIKTYPQEVSILEKINYLFRFLLIQKTKGNHFTIYSFILKSIFI